MQHFRRERPITFLDLPAEVRIEIYDLLLVERQTVRIPERLLSNAVDFNIHPSCVFVGKYMRKPRLYCSPWLEPAISGLSEQ